MNKIQKIIHSTVGKYIISILLGLGLASLFRKVCNDRSCLVFYAPPLEKVDQKVFEFDNECYTFKARGTACHKHKETVNFETKKE
jgi:hypothetical protein